MTKLSIMTWNISQAMARPDVGLWQASDASPEAFNLQYVAFGISRIIIDSGADIVILQELPSIHAWKSLPGLDTVYRGTTLGGAQSHCGYSVILVSRAIGHQFKICFEAIVGPTLVVVFSYGKNSRLAVIGGHLTPSAAGRHARTLEIAQAVMVARTHCRSDGDGDGEDGLDGGSDNNVAIIFGGDLNMRNAETKGVESHGLADAFVTLGSPKDREFTWNSRQNKYHRDGMGFTCRFDRFLYSAGGIVLPTGLRMIGNIPVTTEKPGHYLSDHYGLVTTWDL